MRSRYRAFVYRWAALLLSTVVFLLGGSVEASPFTRLNDNEVNQVLDGVAEKRAREGHTTTREALAQLGLTNAFILTSATSCPLEMRVANISERAMWNIAVSITQFPSSSSLQDFRIVHIPVLPGKSMTRVRIGCSKSQTPESSSQLTVKYEEMAAGARLTPALAGVLVSELGDARYAQDEEAFREGAASRSRALDALELLEDDATFNALAAQLLTLPEGARILGNHLKNNSSARARLTQATLEAAPPASTSALLRAVVGSKEEPGPQFEAVAGKACAAYGSPGAGHLLTAALEAPETSLRARIVASCRPPREKIHETMAAITVIPDAASMLEVIGAEEFAIACKGLRTNRRLDKNEMLRSFIERTQDAVKLRAAVDCLAPKGSSNIRTLAKVLARSTEGAGTAAKRQLLAQTIDKAGKSSGRVDLLADLLQQGFDGDVQSSSLWQQIVDMARAEPATAAVLGEQVAKTSKVFDPAEVLSASKEGKLDMLAFLRFNRLGEHVGSCTAGVAQLRTCGEFIQKQLGAAAPKVKPDVTRQILDVLSRASRNDIDRGQIPQISAMYAPLGLDTQTLAQNVCNIALEDVRIRGHDFDAIAQMAAAIDPRSSCLSDVSAVRVRQMVRVGLLSLASVFATAAVLGFAIVRLRRRWRPLRHALSAGHRPPSTGRGPEAITGRLNENAWNTRFKAALRILRADLENTGDDASHAAAAAIARLEGSSFPRLAKQVRLVAIAALENGVLRSLLARIDGMLVYALVFPDQHDDPRSIRRYMSFSGGWIAHTKRLRKLSRRGQDAGAPLLALLVFLRPDASDGSLLFGYNDGRLSVFPGLLLEEAEVCKAKGRVHPDAYPLALAECSPELEETEKRRSIRDGRST